MEEEEIVTKLSRKELRKQKLMEYLSGKAKLKQPNPKPYLRDDCQVKRPVGSALKVVSGKENKVPADRFTHERTKVKTLAAESTKLQKSTRGAFSDSRKVNVSAGHLTRPQSANRPSANRGSAPPQRNQNHLLTRRTTALSSGCIPTAVSRLKKQPNAGVPSSGRASSNAAATKSNSRLISGSKATWSRPAAVASVRMSLGPMVKTKTGLVPAAIQPRDVQGRRNATHTSAAAADPSAEKMQSSTLSSAQSKPSRTTCMNKNQGARAGIGGQNQSNPKPLVSRRSQPPSKIPPSSGLRSKPQGSTAGAAAPPAERSTKHRPEAAAQEKRPPGGGCGVLPAAAAEKNKTCGGSEADGGRRTAKAQSGLKRMSAPETSRTAPRPNAADTEAPAAPVRVLPQTEGRKMTAAQEERTRKLQEWREAKGISYKRPPMPVKPQVRRPVAVAQPFWGSMSEEDEARSLVEAVDRSLADCIKLLVEGFPTDRVREVLSRLPPVSRKFAKYWICRARLMERDGQLEVLPVFEEAVGVVLEPLDELRTVVFQILKKKDEIKAPAEEEEEEEEGGTIPAGESVPESVGSPTTPPRPTRALIRGERGDSSVVKYRITSTPGGALSQQGEPARVNGQEVRFLTPVRRSVRIERSSLRYPASLQDHDLCVASYGDLISEEEEQEPMYVYRQNEALDDRVSVRLVYDEAV